jgi:hypothetical protein
MSVSLANRDSPLDFANPYDLMVGLWGGMATLYNGKGAFLSLTPSMVAVYWKQRPTLLCYRQLEEPDLLSKFSATESHPAILRTTINIHFDLKVSGKHCESATLHGPGLQHVEGTETRPGIYIFNLQFRGGRYYNNQYFMDANERHIIGPYIRDNSPEVAFVVAQAFTRVSYDVPDAARSELGKA